MSWVSFLIITLMLIFLAPSLAAGKITRFTDSQGVVHITSSEAEPKADSEKAASAEHEPPPSFPQKTAPAPPVPHRPPQPPGAHPPHRPGVDHTAPPPAEAENPRGPQSSGKDVIRIYSGSDGKIELTRGPLPTRPRASDRPTPERADSQPGPLSLAPQPSPGHLLPVQVVARKGESLSKIITRYYPDEEKIGLEAVILANPEIHSDDVIYPDQVINVPRIDFSEQTMQLADQRFYALYGRYYSPQSWTEDQPWLEKNQVKFLVRVTTESTGRMIRRIFIGGYETKEGVEEAKRRLITPSQRARLEAHQPALAQSPTLHHPWEESALEAAEISAWTGTLSHPNTEAEITAPASEGGPYDKENAQGDAPDPTSELTKLMGASAAVQQTVLRLASGPSTVDESSLQRFKDSRDALTFNHFRPVFLSPAMPVFLNAAFNQPEAGQLPWSEGPMATSETVTAPAIRGFVGEVAVPMIADEDLQGVEAWVAAARQDQFSGEIIAASFNPLPNFSYGIGPENNTGARPVTAVSRVPTVPLGKILSYRDDTGIIHISNVPADGLPAAVQVAAGVQEKELHPSPALPPAVQPVSWPPPDFGVKAAKVAATTHLGPSGATSIRRYRDRKGVWRITNDAAPEPGLPGPHPVTPVSRQPVLHAAPAQPTSPLPAPAWMQAATMSAALPAGKPGVVARRDRQGVVHISNSPTGGLPQNFAGPLAFLGKLNQELASIIAEAAQIYRLPTGLILAVIRNESNFAPWAVSPKGAMGLMQLMPGTAADLGVRDPFSPRENILAGCRYLRFLLDHFQGELPLAVAAYNAGHQRVVAAGYQIPPIKETQDFVTQVLGLYYLMEKGGQRL
jgi:hypothetical protein